MTKAHILATGSLAILIAAAPAWGFQEQRVGGSGSAPSTTAPATQGPDAGAALAGDETGAKSPAGTEVRIPGLGKLGVIPKVDFGLELLYGATDPKRPSEPPAGSENADGVTVRGKLKF